MIKGIHISQGHTPVRREHGITLIELMVVIAIVSILAAIVYPSYQDQVRRARRAEAKAMLVDAQARQERYYFTRQRYASNLANLGYASVPVTSENGFYTLSYSGGFQNYTLKATPTGITDTQCNIMTLTNTGVEGVESATLTADACWR